MKLPILTIFALFLFASVLRADFTPVQLIEGPQPAYPAELIEDGQDGEVRIRATIDEEGRVKEAAVVSASHEAFGEAARAAVQQWRFQPAVRDGRPVLQTIVIPLQFRLSFQDRINALAGYPVFVNIDERTDKVHTWADVRRYFNIHGGEAARTMEYPEHLRGSGISEEIIVECVICPEGRPLNPRLVDLKHRELALPAIEHLVKQRFEKPRLRGKPVYVRQRVRLICAE